MKTKLFVIMVICTCMLIGCANGGETYPKLSDLEFTVVGADEIPDGLNEIISDKGDLPFQFSYSIGEDLYIVVGYGLQQSAGYSITVNELYETKDNIVIDTSLIGPGSVENVTSTTSVPYIVVKTHNIEDKIIEFR